LTIPPSPVAPQRAPRCRPREGADGGLRPTDLVGAFFVGGIAFLVAGAIAAVVDSVWSWTWGRWLTLHLLFVGGISQLVLGASQFFLGAFLATDPPPRALIRAQLGCWNAGAILLALAVPAGWGRLVDLAVLLLLAGLAGYAAAFLVIRRRALRRAPYASRWYLTGTAFLALGIVAGVALAHGAAWPHGNLLGAHMALNLAGWLGAAIIGTLHTFYPSLTRTQLPRPRLERWTFAAWVGGVGALAAGYGWSLDALSIAGWVGLGLAALLLAVNIAGCIVAAPRPLSLPARLLGVAQGFLVAGTVVAALAAVVDGPGQVLVGSTRAVVATLLLPGWVGMTVLGSLLHLLAVVVRVRDFSRPLPAPRPVADIGLTVLAGTAIGFLALARAADLGFIVTPAVAGALAAYAVLGLRVIRLAATVLITARPNV
jgi:nitrite reductase (NO-forming)